MKPSMYGKLAAAMILFFLLLAGYVEVNAMPSLAEQRRQREISQQMRHEENLARIEARARVEAAKARKRSDRRVIIYERRAKAGYYDQPHKPLYPNRKSGSFYYNVHGKRVEGKSNVWR